MKFVDNLKISTKILSVIALLSCVTVMAIALGAMALYKHQRKLFGDYQGGFSGALIIGAGQSLPE